MFDVEMVRREPGPVEDGFASLAGGGQELSLLLAAQEKAKAALRREREHAAVEAQDVLSQADEALVLG